MLFKNVVPDLLSVNGFRGSRFIFLLLHNLGEAVKEMTVITVTLYSDPAPPVAAAVLSRCAFDSVAVSERTESISVCVFIQ